MDINWRLVVQARVGSTRLPGKMLLPFADHPTLIGLILQKLKDRFGAEKIILATSNSTQDDALVPEAESRGIQVFRGSEKDVLDRFIGAATAASLTHLVRVCADNPFLSMDAISDLVEEGQREPAADYISWFFPDGRPTIRSHSGFFAEWVTVAALNRIKSLTSDPFFHEHITSYIFDQPSDFIIKKIPLPADRLDFYGEVRLTIDTLSDFQVAEMIFNDLVTSQQQLNPGSVYNYLRNHPDLQAKMTLNIKQNEK